MRHYVRLSQKNYAIDAGIYPLGSCTMKHNPRLNEKMARLPGFADIHPLQPLSTVPGALELIAELSHWLIEMTGMAAVAMSPKAGAHGELCGMMAIKAALAARGETRTIVLVPESAHGTNPATAALLGYKVVDVPARADGTVDPEDGARSALTPEVAAIMLTNPNTCGLFERDIVAIAEAVHAAGAYFYADGANFNAIVGKVRPGDLGVDAMHINLHKTFSTPHGGGGPGAGPVVLSKALAPFAPMPFLRIEDGRRGAGRDPRRRAGDELPFGRLTAFHGQMGMYRARARLHALPRRRRPAPGLGGCGAQRQLRPRRPARRDEPALRRPHLHARGAVRRPLPRGHRRHHARFRQGDDRRGLPPDDHVFPAGRPRRHADRADRVGIEGLARPVRGDAARPRHARPSAARPSASIRRRCSPRAGASTRPAPRASPKLKWEKPQPWSEAAE